MNLHLYKVLDLSDYGNYDDLEKTQVMTEKDLRREFGYAVNNDIVPIQLMKDYQYGKCANEDWSDPENTLRIGVIINMMNDICNYNSGTGYYISETDIDTQLDRKTNSYLDARYDLVCSIIQEFFAYYDKAMTPDNDTLNAFVCEQSKEIDDIIKDFENNKE